jgi:peptidylprolyl isomerase
MTGRRLLAAFPLLAAALVAGCGSNNSDTAQIQPPPSQNQTLSFTATATSATGPTGTTGATGPTIVTPSSGPLSVEPKVTSPGGKPPTKLIVKDLIKGSGAAVASGDTVTVNYVGVLYDNGKVFDSSWSRRQTFPTPIGVGAVIPGWDQGLIGMRVGGRRELTIPPALAYKSTGQGSIPPNATLIFVIDLLALTPASGHAVTGATVATGALGGSGSTGSTGSTTTTTTTTTATTTTTSSAASTGSTGATGSTGSTGATG